MIKRNDYEPESSNLVFYVMGLGAALMGFVFFFVDYDSVIYKSKKPVPIYLQEPQLDLKVNKMLQSKEYKSAYEEANNLVQKNENAEAYLNRGVVYLKIARSRMMIVDIPLEGFINFSATQTPQVWLNRATEDIKKALSLDGNVRGGINCLRQAYVIESDVFGNAEKLKNLEDALSPNRNKPKKTTIGTGVAR